MLVSCDFKRTAAEQLRRWKRVAGVKSCQRKQVQNEKKNLNVRGKRVMSERKEGSS